MLIALIVAFVSYVYLHNNSDKSQSQTTTQSATSNKNTKDFNKNLFSINDPKSIWVIVNKQRPLNPLRYAPDDLRTPSVPLRGSASNPEMQLRKEAADAFELMTNSAKHDDISLMLASGYRSYGTQVSVYNNFVKTQGQATADTQSARPGHSEHQTGFAVDVAPANKTCVIEDCFASTKEGKWVAENAYKFGFIIRYQQNTSDVVGYKYEPWHLRYVGKELSIEINKQGMMPLETFFNLPDAPNY